METTGYSRWFERLLAELGFEVWIGDAAEIKTRRAKKKKTDREDARLLLKLLLEDRFPRIWVPSPENRDLRQLLWHRHRLVQMRTRIMNQLEALAMNENRYWRGKLWSERGRAELEKLPLAPWTSRRRQELLELLDRMNPTIEELTANNLRLADHSLPNRVRSSDFALELLQGYKSPTSKTVCTASTTPSSPRNEMMTGTMASMSESRPRRVFLARVCSEVHQSR
jgi:transposase